MPTPQQVVIDVDELEILVRHLKLAAGARLLVVVCTPAQVEPMLEAVTVQLTAAGKARTLLRLEPYLTPDGRLPAVDEETLLRMVFEPLTTGDAATRPETLVVVDGSHGSQQDEHAWNTLFSRLNLARNTVMRRLGGPLLLALSPPIFSWLARGAPDLYSVRSAVVRFVLDAPPTLSAGPLQLRGTMSRSSPGRSKQPIEALSELLTELFDPRELESVLRLLSNGRSLADRMPRGAPLEETAHAMANLLGRHGLVDRELFELISRERPMERTEIAAVAGLWGVQLAATPQISSSDAAPRSIESTRIDASDRPMSASEALLILASYNPEEVLPGRIHDLRLYLSAEADDRADWERTTWTALRALRQSLVAQGRGKLLILPRCLGSLAVRAGAVFHRASGLDVAVAQRDDFTGLDEIWSLDGQATPATLRTDDRTPERGQAPEEVHLLLSITRDVFPLWSRWRFDHDQPAVMLHVRPSSGPGRASVQGAAAARDLALTITNLLLDQRTRYPTQPIRIFYAGPNGLAVAIGRGLNALGEIILMDLDKYRGAYVESFRFRAG